MFNAKELDEESGMYYYEARYYAPPSFISRDPHFESYPTMSPYAYCANNPVKYIDPTGMDTEDGLGDFFDRQGRYLGHDNKKDGKVYILNAGKAAKFDNKNVNWGGELSEKHSNQLKANSTEVDMDSDLGYMIRTVYSEMRGGDDNAKQIVAESIKNRSERKVGSYENPDGTYKGVINVSGAYSVTNSKDGAHDSYINPTNYIYNNDKEKAAWITSISTSIKVDLGVGDRIGKGVTTYNSSSATRYDNNSKYQKINLDINHRGIKGLWKIR
jgi:RHS repeat-associated protein